MSKKRPSARDHRPSHIVWLPNKRALAVKRAETGVKVYQIAQDLGRSLSHVSDVMNGRRTSEIMAKALADYFSVPVENLFTRVDIENPDQASAA